MIAYVTELNEVNFDDSVKEGLVLVDVAAVWCSPCRQLSPIVDKLSADFHGKITVGKVDADGNPNTAEILGVRSIRTLIFYKDGKIVERLKGMQTYQKLKDIVEKYS